MALPNTNPTYQYLTSTAVDGAVIGKTANDLVSFHGSVPVSQAAAVTSVTTTGSLITTGANYGFNTSTQADSIVTNLNAITALLKAKGLMASS